MGVLENMAEASADVKSSTYEKEYFKVELDNFQLDWDKSKSSLNISIPIRNEYILELLTYINNSKFLDKELIKERMIRNIFDTEDYGHIFSYNELKLKKDTLQNYKRNNNITNLLYSEFKELKLTRVFEELARFKETNLEDRVFDYKYFDVILVDYIIVLVINVRVGNKNNFKYKVD